jgi:hypothetical protein
MKQRKRASQLKQRQLEQAQALYAGVRPHVGPVLRRRQDKLTAEEEALLTGITTSGQFTLAKVASMYAGVKRLRTTAAIADAKAGKTTRTTLKRL